MRYLSFTKVKYSPMICLGITLLVDASDGKFPRVDIQGVSTCVKDSNVFPL